MGLHVASSAPIVQHVPCIAHFFLKLNVDRISVLSANIRSVNLEEFWQNCLGCDGSKAEIMSKRFERLKMNFQLNTNSDSFFICIMYVLVCTLKSSLYELILHAVMIYIALHKRRCFLI